MLLVLGSPGVLGRPDITLDRTVPTAPPAPTFNTGIVPVARSIHVAAVVPTPTTRPEVSSCSPVATPPSTVSTQSKYDQADVSRSTVSTASAASRDAVMQPIRNAVRAFVAQSPDCMISIATRWAAADALGRMRSEDAYLTRDRFVAEIAMALLDSKSAGVLHADDRAALAPWLSRIASSTVEFYTYRAGPKSKRNNHRYWAGLAVGAVGYLLEDPELIAWADRSFEIGVCQVDARGLLPLELARGSQALNYHVYALRPLKVYAGLAHANGDRPGGECRDGLDRLMAVTRSGVAQPREFALLTGKVQAKFASERSFSSRFQLTTLGVVPDHAELSAPAVSGASSR